MGETKDRNEPRRTAGLAAAGQGGERAAETAGRPAALRAGRPAVDQAGPAAIARPGPGGMARVVAIGRRAVRPGSHPLAPPGASLPRPTGPGAGPPARIRPAEFATPPAPAPGAVLHPAVDPVARPHPGRLIGTETSGDPARVAARPIAAVGVVRAMVGVGAVTCVRARRPEGLTVAPKQGPGGTQSPRREGTGPGRRPRTPCHETVATPALRARPVGPMAVPHRGPVGPGRPALIRSPETRARGPTSRRPGTPVGPAATGICAVRPGLPRQPTGRLLMVSGPGGPGPPEPPAAGLGRRRRA